MKAVTKMKSILKPTGIRCLSPLKHQVQISTLPLALLAAVGAALLSGCASTTTTLLKADLNLPPTLTSTGPAAKIYSLAGEPADDQLWLDAGFDYNYEEIAASDGTTRKWLKLAVPSPPAGANVSFLSKSLHLDAPQTIGIMWSGILRGSATAAKPVHVTFGPNSGSLRHYLEFADGNVVLKARPDPAIPSDPEGSKILGSYSPDKIHTVIVRLDTNTRKVYVFFNAPTTTLVNRTDDIPELPEAFHGDRGGDGKLYLGISLSGLGPTSYLISDVLMTTGPARRSP